MIIFVNPGSGPVAGATEEHAAENMRIFIADLNIGHLLTVRLPIRDDEDGRSTFLLWREGTTRCHEIQMPGLPLSEVRWMDGDVQNIWNFPRLYVDGSSWVWKYALDAARDFTEPEDCE